MTKPDWRPRPSKPMEFVVKQERKKDRKTEGQQTKREREREREREKVRRGTKKE